MTSQTRGGLIKTSTAWEPEILRRADEIARELHSNRSKALNYLASRGIADYEREQAELRRLRGQEPSAAETAA